LLVACAPAVAAAAVTTNWTASGGGNFNLDNGLGFNWDNGVPTSADSAVFARGAGVTYNVTFPGNTLIDPVANYVSDH
jgi:hypothetical protein